MLLNVYKKQSAKAYTSYIFASYKKLITLSPSALPSLPLLLFYIFKKKDLNFKKKEGVA